MNIYYEIQQAIQSEIKAQKKNLDQRDIRVEGINFVGEAVGGYIYELELERRIRLIADQPITLFQTRQIRGTIEGRVIDLKDYKLLAFLDKRIDEDNIHVGKLLFDPTFILKALEKRLIEDNWLSSEFPQNLLDKRFPQFKESEQKQKFSQNMSCLQLNENQQQAFKRSMTELIHIIWGPPGTGKTRTMGHIIAEQISKSHVCLLLSISNVAVDQLLNSVLTHMTPEQKKDVIRFGVPDDRALDIYTPHQRVLQNNSESAIKFKELQKKRGTSTIS